MLGNLMLGLWLQMGGHSPYPPMYMLPPSGALMGPQYPPMGMPGAPMAPPNVGPPMVSQTTGQPISMPPTSLYQSPTAHRSVYIWVDI